MKKKKTIRLASLLLVFVMATSALLGGTLAKYTSTATGEAVATVAKWEVELNGTDVEDLTQEKKTATFNLFDTIKDSNGVDNETDVATDLIAPGTSGAFALEMTNNSEVNANGSLTFMVTKPENVNIDFKTGADYGLPVGYTPVEYIESTGTQFIDTGVIPNTNTRVDADFQIVDTRGGSYVGIFGSRHYLNPGYSDNFRFEYSKVRDDIKAFYGSMGASGRVEFDTTVEVTARHTVSVTATGVTLDGVRKDATAEATFTENAESMYVFTFNNNGGAATSGYVLRMYAMEIFDGEELIRDFVPCVNAAGAAGLYDVVNGEFYGNEGYGTFMTGAVLGLTETATPNEYVMRVPLAMGETKNLAFDWLWAYEEGETAEAIATNDAMDTAAGIAAREAAEGAEPKVTVDITAVFEQVD